MSAPYRDEAESLRAEVARLTAAAAKAPTRWVVDADGYGRGGWSDGANTWALLWVLGTMGVGAAWVLVGHDPRVVRAAWLTAGGAVAWALAFVRRVPR